MASALSGVQGDTIQIELALTRPDANGDRVAVDLTDVDIVAAFKDDPTNEADDAAEFVKSVTGGGILVTNPPTAGIATIIITPDDTSELSMPLTLSWDARLVESASVVSTVASGTLALTLPVTRSPI